MVNVKLLKKVRKLIAEEPRRLRMHHWGIRHKEIVPNLPPCKTTACLAGHIILASARKKDWPSLFTDGELTLGRQLNGSGRNKAAALASKLIGIKYADCPFFAWHWEVPEVLAWIDRQIDAASK